MNRDSFIFKRLSILHMPGLPRGLPPYLDFAPHINIIFGPNGSGKSSTGRSIRELIWRQATGEVMANAVVNVGDEEWELKLDGKKSVARRNGREDSLTGIPTSENSQRYLLALHELVAAVDDELAHQIINESRGYDLDAAQGVLRYAYGPYTKGNSVYKEFITAGDSYKLIVESQGELKRQQEKLVQLQAEKRKAEENDSLLRWNAQLREYVEAKQLLSDAETLVLSMPAVLESLTGQEYNDLQEINRQLTDLEAEISRLEKNISTAQNRQAALNFPTGGLPATLLDELDLRINSLNEIDRAITDSEQEIARSKSREKTALKAIDDSQDVTDWQGVTWMDIEMTDGHLQKAHLLQSQKAATEALIAELQNSLSASPNAEVEKLVTAIHTLTSWLQEVKPEQRKSLPFWSLWLLASLGILPGIAVWIFGEIGLVAILLPVVAAVIFYFSRKNVAPANQDIRQGDYIKTGLPGPANWEVASVQKRLEELVDELGPARWEKQVMERVKIYQAELESFRSGLEEINQQYDELKGRLALLPKAPSDNLKVYDAMYWYLSKCGDWHKHQSERKGQEEGLATLTTQRNEELEEINNLLRSANADFAVDAASAWAIVKLLKENDRIWRETVTAIEGAVKNTDDLKIRVGQLNTKLAEVYNKTGIELGMEDLLKELLSQRSAYLQAKQECLSITTRLQERERNLQAHTRYQELFRELESVNLQIIDDRVRALNSQPVNIEALSKEIADIYARIGIAESGNNLEKALKEKDDCLISLEELYDTNLESITGILIIDALKKQADERDMPEVFRRANNIFARVTNGKYQLKLNSGHPPSFGAYDTVESQWRNLNELSTGTRIQLLLSVRLAFIESIESSVRIPIVADELLANSDQQRAAAIADALVEISSEGRQIFYFTSKEDEVSKWQELLANRPEISGKVFLLNGQENQGYEINLLPAEFEFTGDSMLIDAPEVGGNSHMEYGRLLGVNSFDLLADRPERLHIWYLFEDPNVVHAILQRGITRLGQLRMFILHSGVVERLDDEMLKQVEAIIAVFERFQLLFQKGRSRRINRIVLEKSGVVTGRYIDEVTTKLEELDYDPERLLESLENRGVSGFRSDNIEKLREYLLAEQYISEEEVLSSDDIWIQLAAIASNLQVRVEDVKRVVSRIVSE